MDVVEVGDVEEEMGELVFEMEQERMKNEGKEERGEGITLMRTRLAGETRIAEEEMGVRGITKICP